ncbi:MAG TPA: hypothetical protein VFE47_23445 [Tepidisphaeraceae bacterium]|jgi:hypothetical protein|nr:hypothetical protein [Tepidisphaeraceae bacterium]
MLSMLFLICAVVGAALVLAQLLLSVVAFGAGRGLRLHHRIGGSVAARGGGLHRGGMHRSGARGGLFRGLHHHHAGVRGGVPANSPHGIRAAGSGRQSIKTASKTGTVAKSAAGTAGGHYWGHLAMTWVMGMLNLQGIVAGLTVFGLVGLAANAAKRPGPVALKLGIAAAVVMMASVSGILSMMTGLERDGTVDLQQAIGQLATVYLSIPEKNQGRGKITVTLQQRTMEFLAVTFQDNLLSTGQKVMIVGVLDAATMLVVPAD